MDDKSVDTITAVSITLILAGILAFLCYEKESNWRVYLCFASGPLAGWIIAGREVYSGLWNLLPLTGLTGWFIFRAFTVLTRISRIRNLLGACLRNDRWKSQFLFRKTDSMISADEKSICNDISVNFRCTSHLFWVHGVYGGLFSHAQ